MGAAESRVEKSAESRWSAFRYGKTFSDEGIPMNIRPMLVLALVAAAAYSQSTVFVSYPVKNGFVSSDSGGAKSLSVNGRERSVGWIVFNTQGIDVRNLSSSILVLPVKSVKIGGLCGVHELMTPVVEPENRVTASVLHYDDLPIATVSLDSSFSGRMILLNVTEQVRSRMFKGVVIRSMSNCSIEFNSRESVPSPALLCTSDPAGSRQAKWWSGSGRPDLSVGKQGDFYAEMGRGVIFRKATAAWDSITTLIPPPPPKAVVVKKPQKPPKRPINKKASVKPPNSSSAHPQTGTPR